MMKPNQQTHIVRPAAVIGQTTSNEGVVAQRTVLGLARVRILASPTVLPSASTRRARLLLSTSTEDSNLQW